MQWCMTDKPKVRFYSYDKQVFVESDAWDADLTIASCDPLPGHPGVYVILVDDLLVKVAGRQYLLSSPQYASSKSWLSDELLDEGAVGSRQNGFYPGFHRCPGPKLGSKSAKAAILSWVLENSQYHLNGGKSLPADAIPSFFRCFDEINEIKGKDND